MFCNKCRKILPSNGFVITPDKKNVCLECGKKLYPDAFESLSIYIFEDGIPGIILPLGILIPTEKLNRLTSTVCNNVLEDYYHQIAEKTNFSRKRIEILVDKKIKAFSRLVSEETSLRLIAQELGFDLKNNLY